jgi:hypothetical protein
MSSNIIFATTMLAFVGTYKLYKAWTKWWLIPDKVETGARLIQRLEYRIVSDSQLLEYRIRHSNHDHQKWSYHTREGAEIAGKRMHDQRCESWERLNVYYNDELDDWFIGKGSRY